MPATTSSRWSARRWLALVPAGLIGLAPTSCFEPPPPAPPVIQALSWMPNDNPRVPLAVTLRFTTDRPVRPSVVLDSAVDESILEILMPYFESIEYRTLDVHGSKFDIVIGTGFHYPAYREGVLKRINERFYQIPEGWPVGGCNFKERYGFE